MKITKKGLQQLRKGHPWLWDDMVEGPTWPRSTALLPLGEHWFLFSPRSKLRLRRLGPSSRLWPSEALPREPIEDLAVFKRYFEEPLFNHLESVTRHQSRLVGDDSCFRWIFAENHGLPGLVIDVFSNVAVAQIQSAPLEWIWPVLKEILEKVWQKVFPLKGSLVWVEDRSSALRKLDHLEIIENPAERDALTIKWNEFIWEFRPGSSQKTGAYLDQRANHRKTAEWARTLGSKNAWDLCCFEGGFGLHLSALKIPVTFVDQSEKALEAVRRNLTLNQLNPMDHEFVQSDVFDFLKERGQTAPRSVDLIVLDPPSFTRRKEDKARALRGYFELHRQALKCLAPGGMLVSCSCSHHITRKDLEECIREASHQTRRDVRMVDIGAQAPDHGYWLGFPESEYLHAIYCIASG
jgi:23S rRNA (cytosine1962-C5)-methyltransferase